MQFGTNLANRSKYVSLRNFLINCMKIGNFWGFLVNWVTCKYRVKCGKTWEEIGQSKVNFG